MISIGDSKEASVGDQAGPPYTGVESGVDVQTVIATDWRKLALGRLAKLVEAEHDVAVLRDRLDLLQSESMGMFQQREQHLLRIGQLESDRDAFFASRFWRWTRPLRVLSACVPRVDFRMRNLLRVLVKQPIFRPVVKLFVRLLPGVSIRLHAGLHAQKR